jgi:hypothetical protein
LTERFPWAALGQTLAAALTAISGSFHVRAAMVNNPEQAPRQLDKRGGVTVQGF